MRLTHWLMGCLIGGLILTGCSNSSSPLTAADLPKGDAAAGEIAFTQSLGGAPACSSCHTIDGTSLVGPSMQGYAARAATETDLAADAYTLQSIMQPVSHMVSGFSNSMYGQYSAKLTRQQAADLIAYLLTLS